MKTRCLGLLPQSAASRVVTRIASRAVLFAAVAAAALVAPASAIRTERVASGLNRPIFVTAPAGRRPALHRRAEGRDQDSAERGGAANAVSRYRRAHSRSERQRRARPARAGVRSRLRDERAFLRLLLLGRQPDRDCALSRLRQSGRGGPVERQHHLLGEPACRQPQRRNDRLRTGRRLPLPRPGRRRRAGDANNRAQNPLEMLGKFIRLDVSGPGGYTVPPSNPFVGNPAYLPEIWALGVRNPYRYSFDRLTGDLWIGEVGQNNWEEVDFQPATSPGGENYGWRLMEGNHCFNPPTGCESIAGLTDPIHEYSHSAGCSITGGYVYRGAAIPALGRHLLLRRLLHQHDLVVPV